MEAWFPCQNQGFMKASALFPIALLISGPALAQIVQDGTIISPALPGGPGTPGLPASPIASGLPASPQFPALPATPGYGLNNLANLNAALSNVFSGPINDQTVTPVLLQLQRSIEQALPVLDGLTQGLPFQAGNSAAPTGTGTFSTGPGIAARPLAADANRPGALSPTGLTGPNNGLAGGAQTVTTEGSPNGAASAMDREALRALMVLQTDLERALPVLATLNGTATNTLAGSTSGGRTTGSSTRVPNTTTTTTTIIPGGTSVIPGGVPAGGTSTR
jgi:hypothetical protein